MEILEEVEKVEREDEINNGESLEEEVENGWEGDKKEWKGMKRK